VFVSLGCQRKLRTAPVYPLRPSRAHADVAPVAVALAAAIGTVHTHMPHRAGAFPGADTVRTTSNFDDCPNIQDVSGTSLLEGVEALPWSWRHHTQPVDLRHISPAARSGQRGEYGESSTRRCEYQQSSSLALLDYVYCCASRAGC
jgi:hypothetical protein